jgi:hypothetical protein
MIFYFFAFWFWFLALSWSFQPFLFKSWQKSRKMNICGCLSYAFRSADMIILEFYPMILAICSLMAGCIVPNYFAGFFAKSYLLHHYAFLWVPAHFLPKPPGALDPITAWDST